MVSLATPTISMSVFVPVFPPKAKRRPIAAAALLCLGFLFFLIGLAAHLKAGFQSRAEISTAGFVAAAIFAGLGVLVFLFSFTKKQS